MKTPMNRRNWIKSSAVMAGSVAFLSGSLSSLTSTAATAVEPSAMPEFWPAEYDCIEDAAVEYPADVPVARLNLNENPFGPSPKAKKSIMEGIDTSFRYGGSRELAQKITTFEGLGQGMVALNAGSTPFLKAGASHFSKEGGTIICGDLSYDDLPRSAAQLGAKVVKVPMTADFKLDLEAMEKAIDSTTKLVYLVNPNNPTATLLDTGKLKAFVERVQTKVPVFIDEAYIDYAKDPQSATCIDLVKKGMNVIVIRTFSKLYGFAGLRMGYMVAQPAMIQALGKYTDGQMAISALTMKAAAVSYQDREFMDAALVKAMESKQFLYDTLKKEGYTYIPSDANFVLFPIKMEGQKFLGEMSKRNVQVKQVQYKGVSYCRVSLGTMEEMKMFAAAFTEIA